MSEAQDLLQWLRDNGIPDTVIAERVGIRRESIGRIRRGAKGYTGESILPTLRDIKIKGAGTRTHTPTHETPSNIERIRAYNASRARKYPPIQESELYGSEDYEGIEDGDYDEDEYMSFSEIWHEIPTWGQVGIIILIAVAVLIVLLLARRNARIQDTTRNAGGDEEKKEGL